MSVQLNSKDKKIFKIMGAGVEENKIAKGILKDAYLRIDPEHRKTFRAIVKKHVGYKPEKYSSDFETIDDSKEPKKPAPKPKVDVKKFIRKPSASDR